MTDTEVDPMLLIKLKAKVYDLSTQITILQREIGEVNNEIAKVEKALKNGLKGVNNG